MDKQQMASAASQAFVEIAENFGKLGDQAPEVAEAAAMVIAALQGGGKVMFCGNGGSAADAQHLAAELLGRFKRERRALPAMALTVNSSTLTAIGNDYSYDTIFARQVEGMGRPGDVLVGISTSGNSENVIAALQRAKAMDIATIGLTGVGGGRMAPLCDHCIRVPSSDTARIQEMHIAIGHMVCEFTEAALSA